MAKDHAESADLAGELVAPHVGTQFIVMMVGSGIRCSACGHPWALLQMVFADGSKEWTAYCPDDHSEGCECGHNRTRRTLQDLGVTRWRRILVVLTYRILGLYRR